MNRKEYLDFLLHAIKSAKPASGGTVVNCRCFYCPDSKNPNSAHMYISIPKEETDPSLYYCHKCHAAGLVTYKTLIEWDIYDENIAFELINHNKKVLKSGKLNKYMNKKHHIVQVPKIQDNDNNRIKLNYINQRIGTNLTYDDLSRLKIVLNLKDFLNLNNIDSLTRQSNIIDQLDFNFVGFLSIDNAFFNMRRICEEGKLIKSIDKRYINYKIFEDVYETSERFYTIPTKIDLNCPERIKIHIAEGPFDILSIYKNLRNEEVGIYSSIAGSNYKGLAMYFIEQYKLPYVEFHFYPDNDKLGSNYKLKKVAAYLKPLHTPVFIHRNTFPGEKDFGVPINRINEKIMEI